MALAVNQTYLIKKYKQNINKCYRQKLIAMGLLPGTSFTVKRIAPLGDPVQIDIHGYALSLRQQELNFIDIEALA